MINVLEPYSTNAYKDFGRVYNETGFNHRWQRALFLHFRLASACRRRREKAGGFIIAQAGNPVFRCYGLSSVIQV
jgi:hypothetical protein